MGRTEAITLRALAIDQAGEAGGAQLCLLDALGAFEPDEMSVFLLSDGAFRARIAATGVTVFTPEKPGAFVSVPRKAGPISMLRGISGLIGMGLQAARLARNCDVLYANTQKALLIGAVASALSGKPLVWHLHDILTVSDTSRAVRSIARIVSNRFADRVIVNSQATLEAYRSVGGKARATLVYNGVDASKFDPDGPAAIRPAEIPDGAPVIGVFSRLSEWKGQHIAIAALESVPDAHLLLVGGALFGQQAYEESLRTLAAKAGLQSRVHFLGNQTDVADWMRACDIILLSSTLAEPFGRVIVEAMAAGKPVVATAAGGVREIIHNEETGLLVPPGDVDAMARAINRLIEDAQLVQRLTAKALPEVENRFSVARYRAAVREILTDEAATHQG